MSHETSEAPWQIVATDLFSIQEKNYLVTVDYYSNFWELDRLYDTSSTAVICKLKTHFARHGIPEKMVMDTGNQFTSDSLKAFMKTYGIRYAMSSRHHHHANGKAESAVKAAKHLI